MADYTGRQLGNYRLIQLLGQGGFADVYLGQHIYLEKRAAIKVLRTRLEKNGLDLFLKEARVISSLEHPNIVRVLEFGVEGTEPYLVMEYAPQGSMRHHYPTGTRLPVATILQYVKQTASALQYAHARGFIHRDIKPENLLLGQNGEILLSDFGIATMAQSTSHRTGTAGTATYMAPEQLHGKPNPASDQYALAITTYEWLCGVPPFRGAFAEVCSQHLFTPAPSMQLIDRNIPTAVDKTMQIALAKDAQARFPSVMAFANALEQAATSGVVPQLPASPSPAAFAPAPSPSSPNKTGAFQPPVFAQSPQQAMQTPVTNAQTDSATYRMQQPPAPPVLPGSPEYVPGVSQANIPTERMHQSSAFTPDNISQANISAEWVQQPSAFTPNNISQANIPTERMQHTPPQPPAPVFIPQSQQPVPFQQQVLPLQSPQIQQVPYPAKRPVSRRRFLMIGGVAVVLIAAGGGAALTVLYEQHNQPHAILPISSPTANTSISYTPTSSTPTVDTTQATPTASDSSTPTATDTSTPAATDTPTATTGTPVPAGTLLYSASWSQGLNGWNGSSQWKVSQGVLLSDGSDNNGVIDCPYQVSVTDYAVEAQVQTINYNPNTNGTYIYFRGDGNNNGYVAGVEGSNAYIGFVNNNTTIASVSYSLDNNWHTYRIEARSNGYTLFIDGQKVVQGEDNTYISGGQIGLVTNSLQENVRSFKVYAL